MAVEALRKAGRYSAKLGRMARFRNREQLADGLDRVAVTLDPTLVAIRRELDKKSRGKPDRIRSLREVIVGTTGQCNASCVHCPTNKISTDHVPRTPMPMPLFEKIVRGISDMKLAVTNQMAFGLFGDGLLDPYVVDRAKLLKAVLPDVLLCVNTNAAAFNKARHGPLVDYVDSITVHCESLTPDVYDELMAPLRLKNVFPKYRQMIEAFPGKVRISVPVSKLNLAELPELKAAFLEMGASDVIFDPMSSRCAEDRTVFDRLSLGPGVIACPSSILDDLIIDSDGIVTGCCQDFEKIEPIGDLSRDSFAETLQTVARKRFAKILNEGRHAEIKTCSRCFGDWRTPQFPYDHPGGIAAAAVMTAPNP